MRPHLDKVNPAAARELIGTHNRTLVGDAVEDFRCSSITSANESIGKNGIDEEHQQCTSR